MMQIISAFRDNFPEVGVVAIWYAVVILVLAISACTPTTSTTPWKFQGSVPMTGELLYTN